MRVPTGAMGIRSPKGGVIEACELPEVVWEPNSVEKKQMFLADDPSLQPTEQESMLSVERFSLNTNLHKAQECIETQNMGVP